MTLSELIAKLEAAEGPTLVLDGMIAATLLGDEFVQWDGAGAVIRYGSGVYKGSIGHISYHEIPSRTGSLDAALSLVPGYHKWIVGSSYAAVWPEDSRLADAPHIYTHGRPALALCIACLKAIQHMETVNADPR